jgi:general secretion pathway protein G
MRKNRRGFTLIELLVVVTIIGIILAIAVFNFLNAIQRTRQKRTMADLRAIATALESYSVDHNAYPSSAAAFTLPTGLSLPTGPIPSGAIAKLQPNYMRVVPLVDPWLGPFQYSTSAEGTDYALSSTGRDGLRQTAPSYGASTNFNDDIILVDGSLVQYPDGNQR